MVFVLQEYRNRSVAKLPAPVFCRETDADEMSYSLLRHAESRDLLEVTGCGPTGERAHL